MRYLHWTNGPGKVWTRKTIFVKKKYLKKMSGFLRQWPLSLHRKTSKIANYGSDFTNFENIVKIFYQYSIDGHFLFYNFCCKIETVDLFFKKNPPNMPKCP